MIIHYPYCFQTVLSSFDISACIQPFIRKDQIMDRHPLTDGQASVDPPIGMHLKTSVLTQKNLRNLVSEVICGQ